MSTETKERTVAATLKANPAVAEAIDSIVSELREAQASITAARHAGTGSKETLDSWLARLESTKGRGAYYPYVGSGIGNAALVELVDGSVKWDMINGIGVHMFGHSDPDMVRVALEAALGDTIMQGNLQFNADSIAFSELLIEEAARFSNLKHAFLTNSGAMANESALKICMQKKDGQASRVMAFADCFMGRSYAMTQIGDSAANRSGLPLNMQVDYMPFYDPEHGDRSIAYAEYHLRQYFDRYPGQYACFVMELIQGEGGFNVAPPEFFLPLVKLCREREVPVWIDEIQTFGRTTDMFHAASLGIGEFVDVLTLGKMSQVCACLFTEAFNPRPGLLSGTFTGSTISLQVGLAMLQRLRGGGYYGENGRIAALQQAFIARMESLVAKHPDWFPPVPHYSGTQRLASGVFGGVGGMMRFTPFGGEKNKVINACHTLFEEGVIAFYCGHGPYHVRFLPAVGVFQPEQFEPVFDIVERSLARVADQ